MAQIFASVETFSKFQTQIPTSLLSKNFQGFSLKMNNLPEGWEYFFDNKTGRIYYYDRLNNRTQWERPTRPALPESTGSPQPADGKPLAAAHFPHGASSYPEQRGYQSASAANVGLPGGAAGGAGPTWSSTVPATQPQPAYHDQTEAEKEQSKSLKDIVRDLTSQGRIDEAERLIKQVEPK